MKKNNLDTKQLRSVLESLLLAGGEALSFTKLAKILELEVVQVETALQELAAEYEQQQRGFTLIFHQQKVSLASRVENAAYVEKMVAAELQEELSNAALEVVAIIAYKGPISKPEIEAIRGVNCAYTLKNLLLRGLIEKRENPQDARGYLYEVSLDFLKQLGLEQVNKLPDYAILSKDRRLEQATESLIEKPTA